MLAAIIVLLACIVLAFGAVVLLILNQFKDEPPTWKGFFKKPKEETYWDFIKKNNENHWYKKLK